MSQSSEEIVTDNRFDISGVMCSLLFFTSFFFFSQNEFQNRDPEIGVILLPMMTSNLFECNDEWARRCGYLRFTVMGNEREA